MRNTLPPRDAGRLRRAAAGPRLAWHCGWGGQRALFVREGWRKCLREPETKGRRAIMIMMQRRCVVFVCAVSQVSKRGSLSLGLDAQPSIRRHVPASRAEGRGVRSGSKTSDINRGRLALGARAQGPSAPHPLCSRNNLHGGQPHPSRVERSRAGGR
eukprot:1157829-Rhodomonas_salina.1